MEKLGTKAWHQLVDFLICINKDVESMNRTPLLLYDNINEMRIANESFYDEITERLFCGWLDRFCVQIGKSIYHYRPVVAVHSSSFT